MKKKVLFFLILSILSFVFLPGIKSYFGDANHPPLNQMVRWIYLGIFAIAFLLFGLLLFLEWKDRSAAISFGKKLLLGALIGVVLITVVPVFSIDLHCYVMQGRITSIHHQNPYLVAPEAFPDDPFTEGIFWKERITYYGPFWILISVLATFLAQNSVFLNLLLLKLPILAGYLLLLFQGYYLASKIAPERKDIVASFLAFNPFILTQYLVDGHHDILMFALAVWAFNLLYERKYMLSYAVFTLSVLIKYMTVLLAPFMLLVVFKQLKRKPEILKSFSCFAGVFLGITVLAYLPFAGEGLTFFKNLATHKLFMGTGGMDSNTLPYAFSLIVQKCGFLKGIDLFHPPVYLLNIFHAFFAASLSAIFIWLWKSRDEILNIFTAISLMFIAYFTFEAFSFGGWFLIWLLPFLILSGIRNNLCLAFLISIAGTVWFWKRLSFLLIGVVAVYTVMICLSKKRAY